MRSWSIIIIIGGPCHQRARKNQKGKKGKKEPAYLAILFRRSVSFEDENKRSVFQFKNVRDPDNNL